MKKKLLLSLILAAFFFMQSTAQDIHLSHLHAGPLLYNPAMTGLYNADMRFIANYKSQWESIGTDYRTCYASAEVKTRRLFRSTSAMGFGIEIFSDKAGDIDYSQQGAQLTFSGIKLIDGKGRKLFSGGFKAGYITNSFDATKIIAFDQEEIQKEGSTNTGYFDLSAGLTWMHKLDSDDHSYFIGVSMSHINKPEISYGLSGSDAVGSELYRKMIVHGGGDFTIKNKVSVQPSFIFMDQGPNREITVGTFLSYNVNENKRSRNDSNFSMQLGAWVRAYIERDDVKGVDAVIFAAKANIANTSLTFSYDLNISTLTPATIGRGGPELSVIQLIKWKNAPNKAILCPAFY